MAIYLNPKWIVGRTIVRVDLNAARVPDGAKGTRMLHNPVIHLDNGASIVFMTEEDPEGGDYGVAIIYRPAR